MMEDNLFSMKYLSRISSRLILRTLTVLLLFPTNKALAGYPSAYFHTRNLSVDYRQCMDRATKAANLVLGNVGEISETQGGLVLFGSTTVSVTTVMCVNKTQGSTLVVISSGDSWRDTKQEAKSVRDRFREALSSNL